MLKAFFQASIFGLATWCLGGCLTQKTLSPLNQEPFELQFLGKPSIETFSVNTRDQETQIIELVWILSEPENNRRHEFLLGVDAQGNIEKLVFKSEMNFQEIPHSEFTEKFVVVAKTKGLDAILVRCPNCSTNEGGKLIFRYINDGILRTYKDLEILLTRENDSWVLKQDNQKATTSLRLVSKTLWGQIVGIDEIQINH